jgi:hypothetical protein
MQRYQAAITGGLIAGLVKTAVMVAERKTGVLTKTLDRDAVDWIDNLTGSRAVIGVLSNQRTGVRPSRVRLVVSSN